VFANVSDLRWRQKVESRLVAALRNAGVFAVEGAQFFPPTRSFTDEEKVDLLIRSNIDGYISVSVGDSGTTEVYEAIHYEVASGQNIVFKTAPAVGSSLVADYVGRYTLQQRRETLTGVVDGTNQIFLHLIGFL
jgi:hypothetical protein